VKSGFGRDANFYWDGSKLNKEDTADSVSHPAYALFWARTRIDPSGCRQSMLTQYLIQSGMEDGDVVNVYNAGTISRSR
jgi:hypothetical protein